MWTMIRSRLSKIISIPDQEGCIEDQRNSAETWCYRFLDFDELKKKKQ
jgi:hypothetical protein